MVRNLLFSLEAYIKLAIEGCLDFNLLIYLCITAIASNPSGQWSNRFYGSVKKPGNSFQLNTSHYTSLILENIHNACTEAFKNSLTDQKPMVFILKNRYIRVMCCRPLGMTRIEASRLEFLS